jgi:hypothetical protein
MVRNGCGPSDIRSIHMSFLNFIVALWAPTAVRLFGSIEPPWTAFLFGLFDFFVEGVRARESSPIYY